MDELWWWNRAKLFCNKFTVHFFIRVLQDVMQKREKLTQEWRHVLSLSCRFLSFIMHNEKRTSSTVRYRTHRKKIETCNCFHVRYIFFTVENNNPPRAPAALSLISTQQVDLSARRGAQKKTAAGKPFFYDQAPNFRKPWRETRLSLRKSLCVEGVPSLDSRHQRTPFAIQEFIAMVSPLIYQHHIRSWNN